MTAQQTRCSNCDTIFEPRFSYQKLSRDDGSTAHACSQRCYNTLTKVNETCRCDVCGTSFELEFPFQLSLTGGKRRYVCSMQCKAEETKKQSAPSREKRPWRIAVFNHKGGTGKTTTAVSIAAGLAESGKKVLLLDADGQGNVGVSLGIRGTESLYHILVSGTSPQDAAVPVRHNLDVVTSNELLAAAELFLASKPQRDRKMRERLGTKDHDYDVVVIDCAPALSLMNQNALVYADGVLIPVGCDYLSIVGVQQVLRTLRNVRELLRHPVQLWGVLPTFYDTRNRISREAVATLEGHFGDRCLPPVRVNTRLREAPSAKQTIFEYAPESNGAEDYRQVVSTLLASADDYLDQAGNPSLVGTVSSNPASAPALATATMESAFSAQRVAGGTAL